jgi:DNA-binding CsgD family transcriptional regulator/tetratricopeptide (TPR) repeat protein
MRSSGPPSEGSSPHEPRAEEATFAWGKSLDFAVVGREAEIARVQALIDGARDGTAGSLVLRGEAGIGKSTLLHAAETLAPGFRCLWVRGAESERVLAHAGLLQALAPLRHRFDDVAGPQSEALALALGWGTAPVVAERFLVAAGTLSLLAAEAEHQPVLVLVDDAQWVDGESAAALAFAARRLQDDAVCFLWAERTGAEPVDLLQGLPELSLRGLDHAAARELVADRLDPRVADRLADDTAGNPLGMLEVTARLTDAQRIGTAPLPERLPVGDRLKTVYEQVLSELSAPAWRAVLLCALDRSSSTAAVRSALARDGVEGTAALDEAVDRGILVPEGADLVFRHPLLRAAALAVATSAQRRRAHLALAQALSESSPSIDAAWHRAEASTQADPALAEELVILAEESRSRQGYAAASAVLERAALLAGDPADAAELLASAADDAFVAGDVERTRMLAQRVVDESDRPQARGQALLTLGRLELYTASVPRATDVLGSAVDLIDGIQLIRALAELALARFRLGDMAGIGACAAQMAEAADRGDPEQRMLADFIQAVAASFAGEMEAAQRLLTDVVAQIEQPPLRDDPQSLVYLALTAGFLGDVSRVFSLGEHLLAVARDRGAFGVLVPSLALTAAGRAWTGDNAGAFADAGEAAELGEQLGYAVDVANAVDMLAWQSAARGLHEDAGQALVRARQLTDRAGTTSHAAHLAVTEAFCAMCRGDAEGATSVLEARLAADGGVGTGGEPLGIAPDLVEAYVATGRRAEAADLAARFAAVTPSESPPLMQALVARAQGVAAEDDEAASQAFETALDSLAQAGPQPFDVARTQLLYGARLRRGGQRVRAREQLEPARDAFAGMGLDAWAARADDELAATGARARKRELTLIEPLTSQETRVALHAVKGLSNKEIAAALFLSPKTVERHLSSVYRKRGLRSRTELAATFGGTGQLPDDAS